MAQIHKDSKSLKGLLIVFALFCYSNSFGQFPIAVDSLYTFIKYNSIHRKSKDWSHIDRTFQEEMISAKSIGDTMNCFVSVLRNLNDVHSHFILNNQFYGHYPTFEDSVLIWLKPLNDKAISETNTIYTKVLEKKLAYIRVPSCQVFDAKQINTTAQALADSVLNLSKKCQKGFIIDLRLNGGGNMYRMLSGLSPLLGDGIIGYMTDENDEVARIWEIKNGNFILEGYQSTNIKVKSDPSLTKVPVVLILGPVTKSSGSMVAIAFKGRPRTYFIGEPTANGYTTSNGYFPISSNLIFNFATNFVADRNKTIYKTSVNPDLTINQRDNFDELAKDPKIRAASRWLRGK